MCIEKMDILLIVIDDHLYLDKAIQKTFDKLYQTRSNVQFRHQLQELRKLYVLFEDECVNTGFRLSTPLYFLKDRDTHGLMIDQMINYDFENLIKYADDILVKVKTIPQCTSSVKRVEKYSEAHLTLLSYIKSISNYPSKDNIAQMNDLLQKMQNLNLDRHRHVSKEIIYKSSCVLL